MDFELSNSLIYAPNARETKLLLKSGADLIYTRKTALIMADTAEQTKLLHEAASADGTNALIAYVNLADERGRTALMNADTAEQTRLLIDAGANVNAKDDVGQTALMLADTAEQTRLLIEAAGDNALTYINDRDIYEDTALDHARNIENKEKINIILEYLLKKIISFIL